MPEPLILALELRSGVFGIQLVLDETVTGGCAFLEINLRPHSWPLLHDEVRQLPSVLPRPVIALPLPN